VDKRAKVDKLLDCHDVLALNMDVFYFKLSTIGSRAFSVAASQIWNLLSETVISASTLVIPAPVENFPI